MEKKPGIHFIGIGGVGMSGLARILIEKGVPVTGSDTRSTRLTQFLEKSGARVYTGHRKTNIRDAGLVVVSSAITSSNPELKEAARRKIEIISRAQMLARLMRDKKKIVVTGTHGKTTTTSMLSLIFSRCGLRPAFAIGGEVKLLGGNSSSGGGEYFIAEGDESDASFLELDPDMAIVTNIEPEHLDHYGSFTALKKAFRKFISLVPPEGTSVLNADDKVVSEMVKGGHAGRGRLFTFAVSGENATFTAEKIKLEQWKSECVVCMRGRKLGVLRLNVPGLHNISNALAASGAAIAAGIKFGRIGNALKDFRGALRRFEVKGEESGVLVVDDYAHHPSEIEATMAAARGLNRKRIIVIFQPHRYSRTRLLSNELGQALYPTDVIIITRIYSAGEKAIKGVTARLILEGIKGRKAEYMPDRSKIVSHIMNIAEKGDMVLTLGAGDVYRIGEEVLERLKSRSKKNKAGHLRKNM